MRVRELFIPLLGMCLVGACFAPKDGPPVEEDVPSDGAQTDGAQTDVSQTDVSQTDGAQTDGAQTDGAQTDGAQTDVPGPDVGLFDVLRPDATLVDVLRPDAVVRDVPGPDVGLFDVLRPDATLVDVSRSDADVGDVVSEPVCRTLCAGFCVDTMTDVGNCGACGNDCALRPGVNPARVRCAAGACVFTGACQAGRAHCTSDPADGCETMVTTDARNCGACGRVCPAATPNCMAGVCTVARPTRYVRASAAPPISGFVNVCGMPGATMALGGTDDGRTGVPLGFPLRFWASDLPAGMMVNVSSNGFLSLDGSTGTNLSGALPSTTAPNGTIAAYWGDNMNRSLGQCFLTLGTAPSRRQVFQWNDAHHCCSNDSAVHHTYEVVLHEQGMIDVLYQTMMGARAQTVGLENPTGTEAITGCPSGTTFSCAPTTGYTVRYEPAP